jgi:hypothetical protein
LGLGDYPNIGGRRVTVMTAAANQKKFREMGFPIVEDIHRAMQMEGADALQRGDAGFTLYKPEVGSSVEPIDFHQSYDTGIRGQYLGQIEGVSVPPEVMFPDIMDQYSARGKSRADAIGGFMMNTDLRQVADQKWLDNIRGYLESSDQKGNANPLLLAGLAGGSLLGAVAPKAKSEETKEVDPFVQALMDYTSDANFLPSPSERLIPMSEIPAEMKANNPDLIRGITNWAGNAMGGDYYDYRAAEGLMNVADFLPYIGGAISTQQGTDAYRNNRKWEGRMLTGLGLIELYPFLGKMASESIKPVIRPTIRNWDKMGAPWEASDGLLKYLESL